MKFPTEYFEDLYDSQLRVLIDKRTREYGLDSRQPVLFNQESWAEIFKDTLGVDRVTSASMIAAWGFTKVSYQCAPELIDQVVGSDLGELEKYTDALFNIDGCAYFEGKGSWFSDLNVQGYWRSVQNHGDGNGAIIWLLNTSNGLIPVEIPFDKRGLGTALYEYADSGEEFVKSIAGSQCSEETLEMYCMLWIGGIMAEMRLMYYLLSSNSEIKPISQCPLIGYQLNDIGELVVPEKMLQFVVGESIGQKIKNDGVLKNAHWELNADKSFTWLCGADAKGFDYHDAEYCQEVETDEDIVRSNRGRQEQEFIAILTEEESRKSDAGEITDDELRSMIVERVHQARANVAADNGETYDRNRNK